MINEVRYQYGVRRTDFQLIMLLMILLREYD